MLLLILCLLVVVVQTTAFSIRQVGYATRASTKRSCEASASEASKTEAVENDPELKQFLEGTMNLKWKGDRMSLRRRKQVPLPEYSPQKVIEIVLRALQVNDDPQLDHGACVLLEFKSPTGPLADGGLDPAEYGRFLRDTEYSLLIDHSIAECLGSPVTLQDGFSVKQPVKIKGFSLEDFSSITKTFDFYLSQFDECWLIDVVLLQK